MRITRVECSGLVAPPDCAFDFPAQGATIRGRNGSGKTALLRVIGILLGQSSQSLSTLAETVNSVPEATLYLEDEGAKYRLHRRASAIKTQRMEGGAWVELGPTPTEALRKLFSPGADPADLLKPMADSKVIELLLGVVPSVEYDQQGLLKEMGIDVGLDPMPKGGHVLDFLERVETQLAAQRLGIGKARDSAAAVAERTARGLPAQPVPESGAWLASKRADAELLRTSLATLKQSTQAAKQESYREADQAFERVVAAAEKVRQAARERANALSDVALENAPALERAVGAAQQAALDAQAAHDRFVADVALREGLAAARLDAQVQQERFAHVQALIEKVRAKAAAFIGSALPGVRISSDEKGKRFPEVRCKDDEEGGKFWVAWSDANKARRMEVASEWSRLRQEGGSTQGLVSEAIILLDEAEAFDSATFGRMLGRGQLIVTRPDEGELCVEPL